MSERLTPKEIEELNGVERLMYEKHRVKPAEIHLTVVFAIVALGVAGWLACKGGE